MGPWQDGSPQQGNQSRLTPQEIYRAGIRETNLHCARVHGRNFDALPVDIQDGILKELQDGKIELESLGSKQQPLDSQRVCESEAWPHGARDVTAAQVGAEVAAAAAAATARRTALRTGRGILR